eukprot:1259405-Prymnesium_polylepis.1
MLRVVRNRDRRLVVDVETSRRGVAETKIVKQATKRDGLLSGLGGRDDLGLAGRERDGRLLLGAPRDGPTWSPT